MVPNLIYIIFFNYYYLFIFQMWSNLWVRVFFFLIFLMSEVQDKGNIALPKQGI
jgi:hypothetical protein